MGQGRVRPKILWKLGSYNNRGYGSPAGRPSISRSYANSGSRVQASPIADSHDCCTNRPSVQVLCVLAPQGMAYRQL